MTNIIFFTLLLLVSYQDLKKRKIPDLYIIFILITGLFSCCLSEQPLSIPERIAGAFCISFPMFLLTFSRPRAFGGGDIKLMAVCGFYLGPRRITSAAVIALFLAVVYSLLCILIKKADKNTTIPLGPFLSIGMLISTLWEPALLLF